MDLSYAMLEKHIADQEELPDNTDAVSYTHLDVYKRQVLLRSLSNEHTIRTEKLIHGNIKCLCQLLRCIQARTRGSTFVSLYGTCLLYTSRCV